MSMTAVAAARTCFVISPLNESAEKVFDRLIEPVCRSAGYRAIRSDSQLSKDIRDGIVTSLSIAPMVIAYLGRANPDWNNNVILELGYRLTTRLPLVIMCDDAPNITLPFHIKSNRVVRIPSDVEVDSDQVQKAMQQLEMMIHTTEQTSRGLRSNQAVAVIHAPKEIVDPKKTFYVAASERATTMFGVDGQLVGRSLEQFVNDRKVDMPQIQYDAFFGEQARLAKEAAPSDPIVIARIPMVFKSGKYKGRAFLPIVVNYEQVGDIQEYRIMYLDVTSSTKYTFDNVNDRNCYVCTLNPDCKPLELVADNQGDDRGDRIFFAYNSLDRDAVDEVYQLLKNHGCEPWIDTEHLKAGDPVFETIENALDSCRAALIFIGNNDFGIFQRSFELPSLLTLMINKGLRIIPIVMDGLARPPKTSLQNFRWVKFEDVRTNEWAKQFINDILL